MPVESATYISQLVAANPTSTDPINQGDNHIRLLKSVLKSTFPNLTGAITATQEQLNQLDQDETLNEMIDAKADQDDLDTLATTVASLDSSKAPKANPTFSGTVSVPHPALSDYSNRAATTFWVKEKMVDEAIPTGTILFIASNVVPMGFLAANGQWVSRADFARLFTAIGTTYGVADGVNYFALPDLRGVFLRGFDAGRGLDSGRAFGSYQGDAIRNIVGQFTSFTNSINASGVFGISSLSGFGRAYDADDGRGVTNFDASRVVPTAAENRPVNIAMLAVIKA